MNGWIIAWIAIQTMGLGANLAKNGEPRVGKYSFWAALLATAIEVGILWKAGLFT